MNAASEHQHLFQLTQDERLQLAEALLDSVDAERENEPIPQAVLDELVERKARFDADPSRAIPWSEVRSRLRKD